MCANDDDLFSLYSSKELIESERVKVSMDNSKKNRNIKNYKFF